MLKDSLHLPADLPVARASRPERHGRERLPHLVDVIDVQETQLAAGVPALQSGRVPR